MNQDGEMAAWREQWLGAGAGNIPESAVLKARVLDQSRRMRLALIAPVTVTVTIGGWLLARAAGSGTLLDIVLAVEGCLFIAIVWGASLWIARGTWVLLGKTTAAFLDLAIRRCHSNIAATRLGVGLYVAQLVAIFAVVWLVDPTVGLAEMAMSVRTLVLGWIGLPVYVGWTVWFGRRQRAELMRLLELRRQLEGDGG